MDQASCSVNRVLLLTAGGREATDWYGAASYAYVIIYLFICLFIRWVRNSTAMQGQHGNCTKSGMASAAASGGAGAEQGQRIRLHSWQRSLLLCQPHQKNEDCTRPMVPLVHWKLWEMGRMATLMFTLRSESCTLRLSQEWASRDLRASLGVSWRACANYRCRLGIPVGVAGKCQEAEK